MATYLRGLDLWRAVASSRPWERPYNCMGVCACCGSPDYRCWTPEVAQRHSGRVNCASCGVGIIMRWRDGSPCGEIV